MMWSIFWENWFDIDLVVKNGIRNGLGRLDNDVENFWFDFFFCTKKILVTFYCSFFRFLFFGPLSEKGLRNGLGRLVKALEHVF